MTIEETLKTRDGIRLVFMDSYMAWNIDRWKVWRDFENGPITLIETADEELAISVLMGPLAFSWDPS